MEDETMTTAIAYTVRFANILPGGDEYRCKVIAYMVGHQGLRWAVVERLRQHRCGIACVFLMGWLRF
jgi:hypothetical protein